MTELLKYDFTINSLAQHFFPNHEDREDAIQEAYIKLMSSSIPEDNDMGWVYRVVQNLFTDLYNKTKRIHELDQHASIGEAVEEECPLAWTERRAEEEQLGRKLSDLPPDLAVVANYYYFKGWSYKSIAEEFSIPVGTVSSRMNTVRKYLLGE